jgi:hypothetical protein
MPFRPSAYLPMAAVFLLLLFSATPAPAGEPIDRDAVAKRFAEALATNGIRLQWRAAEEFDETSIVLTEVALGLVSDRWVYDGGTQIYLRGVEQLDGRYRIARVGIPSVSAFLDEHNHFALENAQLTGVEFAAHIAEGEHDPGLAIRSFCAASFLYGGSGIYPVNIDDVHMAFGEPEGASTPFEFGIEGVKLALEDFGNAQAAAVIERLGIDDARGYVTASGRIDATAGTATIDSAIIEVVDRIYVEARLDLAGLDDVSAEGQRSILRPAIDFLFLNRALPEEFAKLALQKLEMWVEDRGFAEDFFAAGAEFAGTSREMVAPQLSFMALTQLALMTEPVAAAKAAAALQAFFADPRSLTLKVAAEKPVPFGEMLRGGPKFVIEASAESAAPTAPAQSSPASAERTAPLPIPRQPQAPAATAHTGSPVQTPAMEAGE